MGYPYKIIGMRIISESGISPNIQEIAQRLLAYEACEHSSSEANTPAVVHVCEKLDRPLSKLIGETGSRALLARALIHQWSASGHHVLCDFASRANLRCNNGGLPTEVMTWRSHRSDSRLHLMDAVGGKAFSVRRLVGRKKLWAHRRP